MYNLVFLCFFCKGVYVLKKLPPLFTQCHISSVINSKVDQMNDVLSIGILLILPLYSIVFACKFFSSVNFIMH